MTELPSNCVRSLIGDCLIGRINKLLSHVTYCSTSAQAPTCVDVWNACAALCFYYSAMNTAVLLLLCQWLRPHWDKMSALQHSRQMFIQLHLRLHVCLRLQARRTCIHDLVCMQKSWTQHLSACLTYCNTPDDQSLKFPDNLVTMIQGVRILSQARKEVIDQDCIAAVLTGPFCHCCTEERDEEVLRLQAELRAQETRADQAEQRGPMQKQSSAPMKKKDI